MDGPGVSSGKAEDNTNGGGLNNGTKGLIIIDTGLLGETTDNPSGFIAKRRAINMICDGRSTFH